MERKKIGIRPTIDGRRRGVREGLEEKTMHMAHAAAALISERVFHTDGTPVECVISDCTIGGVAEAAHCAEQFSKKNVCATITVTPCWCYSAETMDLDPQTQKAVWGFNGTERPGAVYLAAAMAAYAQRGLPAFSIYGQDVQDLDDDSVPPDVEEKLLRFARAAIAVGSMRGGSYVNIGGISMGIMGSYCDVDFFQKYLGMRPEWVDMTEVLRRIHLGIFDEREYGHALEWTRRNCIEGWDKNANPHSREQKDAEWEFVVKMAMVFRDILMGNPRLAEMGYEEEALGKNALVGGFQGQRAWTDWLPNGDFSEAILNSSFDWRGKREPVLLATENDTLNAVCMLFGKLLTQTASVFADVRTYWSPDAVKRVVGRAPTGLAENGFIHLINSGSAALDGSGRAKDASGRGVMKRWWEMTEDDITRCLAEVQWCPADLGYFRGGGFSSQFKTREEMPVTLIRLNLIEGVGPTLQIAEGSTVLLDKEMHSTLHKRTDATWPTTWFAPRLGEKGFESVYHVMAKWGSNHGAFSYGHIGADLITLAAMLRIPVSLHNVPEKNIFRPHSFGGFGTKNSEGADYRACAHYGALYR